MSEQSNGAQCQNCGCVTLRQVEEMVEKRVAQAMAEHVAAEHSSTFDLVGFKEQLSRYQLGIEQEQERLKAFHRQMFPAGESKSIPEMMLEAVGLKMPTPPEPT